MQKITPRKGDIFVLENTDSKGHEQSGQRPHVIVTQIIAGVATVAPCTTSVKAKKYPYSVLIIANEENGLDYNSYVLRVCPISSPILETLIFGYKTASRASHISI